MANDFLTEQAGPIASVALAGLVRASVLAQLVHRDISNEFRAGRGDTVTIPVPATLTARRYNRSATLAGRTPIVLDEVAEGGVPVKLDVESYSAVVIPDTDAALNIRNFAEQVLKPQVWAVSEDIENELAATFASLPATNDSTIPDNHGSPTDFVVDAGSYLGTKKVPNAGRVLVMGSAFAARLMKDSKISRYDGAGDNDALRTAQFAPLFGFTPYESLALAPNQAFAFTRDAVALATVVPPTPRGATASATVTDQGIALRWLSDYDAAYLSDRSIVSVLAGAAIIDPDRIVRLKLGA